MRACRSTAVVVRFRLNTVRPPRTSSISTAVAPASEPPIWKVSYHHMVILGRSCTAPRILRPEHLDAVRLEGSIVSDDGGALDQRLRRDHAVERVRMMDRQGAELLAVANRDRQLGEVVRM